MGVEWPISAIFLLFIAESSLSETIQRGDTVMIVTPDVTARLCPYPMCGEGEHLARIPQGTRFNVASVHNAKSDNFEVIWFEVVYKKQNGWISIYDTDKQ